MTCCVLQYILVYYNNMYKDNWKNVWYFKIIKLSIIPIIYFFNSSNCMKFQMCYFPIVLFIYLSSNCLKFQLYHLPDIHSSKCLLFQLSILPIVHSSNCHLPIDFLPIVFLEFVLVPRLMPGRKGSIWVWTQRDLLHTSVFSIISQSVVLF